MLAILHFFLDLCLLKRAPQDLPASREIFVLVFAASMLGSMLLAMSAGEQALIGLLQGLLDSGLMLLVLAAVLQHLGKPTRLLQTATALIGTDTLIGLLALVPLSQAVGAEEQSSALLLAGVLFTALVLWGVLITAHILRHAFEIRLIQGVFLAIVYDVLSLLVVGGMTQGLS
ncbi:hypothetical protein [Rhabdochromatium marinum]|uniref:hypothetical protein n=1 Tax=Rhabdochromatium marinum TaxID=48729 RepID=UPI00190857D8|nr:hypothetical protein [Rhabdochromatium marinum]MBK1647278.1 hypothetical protein [Rhabdochromatium marinum]